MNYNFDGINKIITPIDAPVSGAIDVDVQDIYSRWYDWFMTSDNSKFLLAMRSVGGDPLPGSKALGLTYFLLNNWKIKPYEETHIFTLNGNLYSEDGSNPYISTVGVFNVQILNSVSSLVDSTVQQLAEIEYSSFNNGVTIDVINGTDGEDYPIGTPATPCKTIANAISISIERGFNHLFINGNIAFTLTEMPYYLHGIITGQGAHLSVVTVDGSVFSHCEMHDCRVEGSFGNGSAMDFIDCEIGSISNLIVGARNCILDGTIQLAGSDKAHFMDCVTINNDTLSIIDMNGAGNDCTFTDWSGRIKFMNMTGASDTIGIQIDGGNVTLDSTITNGFIGINGVGTLIDNSSGASVSIDGLMNRELITKASWDIVHLDVINGESGEAFPIGTLNHPSNNLTDAKAIGITNHITDFRIYNTLTLDSSVDGLNFVSSNSSTINLNGQSTIKTFFSYLTVTGTQITPSRFEKCKIYGTIGMSGAYRDCVMTNTTPLVVAANASVFMTDCRSAVPGNDSPVVDFTNGGVSFNCRAYSGGIEIQNSTDSGNVSTIEFIAGKFNFGVSNTAGYFAVRGVVDRTSIDADATATVAISGGAVVTPDYEELVANQEVINDGVKKSSMLIPHITNL